MGLDFEITPRQLARLRVLSCSPDLAVAERTARMATLKGTRRGTGSVERRITMEVWPERSPMGVKVWFVRTTDEDGRVAIGNSEPALDVAIEVVQWHKLDGPVG